MASDKPRNKQEPDNPTTWSVPRQIAWGLLSIPLGSRMAGIICAPPESPTEENTQQRK